VENFTFARILCKTIQTTFSEKRLKPETEYKYEILTENVIRLFYIRFEPYLQDDLFFPSSNVYP
jgi:hypothetical protein